MCLRIFHRGFSLHEALALIEDEDLDVDNITIFPPNNACGDTDEDSGDEDYVDINNLPASLMQNEVEIANKINFDSDWDTEDDAPLSQFSKNSNKNAKKLKKIKKYHYVKTDLCINDTVFQKNEDALDINERDPTSLFCSIFDDELVQKITDETNRYASQKNRDLRVNVSEMKCFLGVILLSGFVPLPRRRMYWERAKDSNNELVSQAIARNKFEFILSNIHCQDNNFLDPSDKFAKVRPLIAHLNKKFMENAYVEEEHSVDEAMIPYTGRHGCKQYIHGKPIRYGFKLWVGTTRQGYINWFEPYQGASTNISETYKDQGVGTSVVLEYADALRSKWNDQQFHLFFDNFFSSIALLENLEKKNMYGTGTIRENRIPGSTLCESKQMKKSIRGSYDFIKIMNSNIIFIKWNDNSIVTFCSNAIGVNPLGSAKRYSQKEKKFIQVEQPRIVKYYNRSMGGVDRSDQNISLYRTAIRGKKWYFPIIAHCVDMAVHNAWQIHKHNGGTMDQLSFRRSIASTLLVQNKKVPVHQRGHPSLSLNNELRYDRLDHWVISQEKQTRCGACHQKTLTRCQKCDIGLHVKCFVSYHTQ